MFSEEESYKFYINIENIMFFESLMAENNILIKCEIEKLTNTKSRVFYSKKSDYANIDEICKQNNIVILDELSLYINERFTIQSLSKPTKIAIQISFFLIILFFIFQNYTW
jgi:hypothetical protein